MKDTSCRPTAGVPPAPVVLMLGPHHEEREQGEGGHGEGTGGLVSHVSEARHDGSCRLPQGARLGPGLGPALPKVALVVARRPPLAI